MNKVPCEEEVCSRVCRASYQFSSSVDVLQILWWFPFSSQLIWKKKTHNELNSSKRKIGNTVRGSRMSRLRFLLCFSTSAFSLLYFSVRYTKTQVIPEQRQERRGLFVNVIKLLDQCYYDNILHIVRLYTFVWFLFSQDLIRSVNSTFHTDKYVQIYSRLCNYIHCVHITHSRSNTNTLEQGCLFITLFHKAVSSVRR